MKASSYIIRLKAAVKKYFEELEAIENEKAEIIKKKEMYSKTYLDTKEKEFQAREIVIKDMTLDKVKSLNEEFHNAVDKWAEPKGENLDTEDLKLLQGYLTLSEKEVQALGEKHKDNAIMLRALKEYAAKNDLYFKLKYEGEDIKEAYDKVHQAVIMGIEGEPEGYRARIIKDDKYFNDLVSNYEALAYNE